MQFYYFVEFIKPICLPTTEYVALQDYNEGNSYVTAGWGMTEFGKIFHILLCHIDSTQAEGSDVKRYPCL